MNWRNELTEKLKIDYPIIQAPMLGVTSVEMVAAISNLGGLGSLPVGGLSPETTLELIRQAKALTNRPFAVNLFANDRPEMNEADIAAMTQFLKKLCEDNGLDVLIPSSESFHFNSYRDQIDILLAEDIPIVSFTFGIPDDNIIKAFKDKRMVLIGTATSLKEAKLLDENNIDMITAQGIEAGGHRGSFLKNEPLPLVGSMSLVPQIAAAINKPVIAAGGIYNDRTIKAAMVLGAQGVQLGSVFIASAESIGIPAYKKAIQNSNETDSVLTNAYTGRWARGLRNKFMEAFENADIKILPYPVQASIVSSIRMAALKNNDINFANLWAGQSASNAEAKPSAEIFKKLVSTVEVL